VLNISCVDIFPADQTLIQELVKLIINNHTITSLDFQRTNIKVNDLKALCTALSFNISVKSFFINGNNLAESVDAIAELIKKNSCIQFLDLKRTKIGDAGVLKLIGALMCNSSLQSMDLTAKSDIVHH
jgi:Leucine Rich repeat